MDTTDRVDKAILAFSMGEDAKAEACLENA